MAISTVIAPVRANSRYSDAGQETLEVSLPVPTILREKKWWCSKGGYGSGG
jgi:hypothetical protein